jgi:hypothetical protein
MDRRARLEFRARRRTAQTEVSVQHRQKCLCHRARVSVPRGRTVSMVDCSAMTIWDSRRIVKELADPPRRQRIATSFWRAADPQSKALATAQLARALHFREESIRKLPAERKGELLLARAQQPEMERALEMAIMQYHTSEASEMMAAFLDRWKIPHENGAIETDDYAAPTADQVREAVGDLGERFDSRDIALYLASAGLLMGDQWREATWPVVDEMAANLSKSEG